MTVSPVVEAPHVVLLTKAPFYKEMDGVASGWLRLQESCESPEPTCVPIRCEASCHIVMPQLWEASESHSQTVSLRFVFWPHR